MIYARSGAILKEIKITIIMSGRLENTIENLDRIYGSFITENNVQSFHIGIYDYVTYIIESGEFDDIIKNFKKDEFQSNTASKNINVLFKKELASVEKNILQIVRKNKIEIDDISRSLDTIGLINKIEEKQGLGSNLKYKYIYLVKALELLHSNGFEKHIRKYFNSVDRDLSDYEFSKFYNSHIEAEESFLNNKKISHWGCWDRLLGIYSVISLIEGNNSKYIKKEVAQICSSFSALEKEIYSKSIKKQEENRLIASNFQAIDDKRKNNSLDMTQDKLCAKRMHNYLVKELHKKVTSAPELLPGGDKQKISIYFSEDKGIYDKNNLGYPIKGKRAKLIRNLKDGKKDGAILTKLLGYDSLAQLSKDKNEINKLFRKKLKQKEDFIIRIPTGGYRLNDETFSINFTDE